MNEVWIQSLGFVALGFNILAGSTTHDNRMRALICCSCITFSIHYMLLGAVVAGINFGISAFRALCSIKFQGYKPFFCFALIQLSMSLFFFQEPRDLLPAVASLFGCYALFCVRGLAMRLAFLFCACLWMINALVVGSYGGLVNDVFSIGILLVAIGRIYKEDRNKHECIYT
ncbi:YgjV family protein [Thaumasiovibrio sp. DFM-14]|uniref:YgjV family protein n=1 Tax=Thaumasiovibrio sp. DFM-14 TaxID=3384792 RepID=UPI0039A04FD0